MINRCLLLATIFGIGVAGCADKSTGPGPTPPAWTLAGAGLHEPVTALLALDTVLIAATVDNPFSPESEAALWRWNGATWSQMSSPIAGEILVMKQYRGAVVVGGTVALEADSVSRGIAQWDGSAWQPVGEPLGPNDPPLGFGVSAMALWNGTLAFAGSFARGAGAATWDGQELRILPCPLVAAGLAVWQGALLAGGMPGGDVPCTDDDCLLEWQQSDWVDFAGGIRLPPEGCPPFVYVSAVLAAQDGVVVTGSFQHVGGILVRNVARWTGQVWEPLGVLEAGASELLEVEGQLLAAEPGAGAPSVRAWNGESWVAVGPSFNGAVRDLVVFGGSVFAAGDFTGHVARFSLQSL
jgi:hypothetical protein